MSLPSRQAKRREQVSCHCRDATFRRGSDPAGQRRPADLADAISGLLSMHQVQAGRLTSSQRHTGVNRSDVACGRLLVPTPPSQACPPPCAMPWRHSQVVQLPPLELSEGLAALWREGLLCDVALRCGPGDPSSSSAPTPHGPEDVPAHAVVLAASCSYFRALLTGAGAAMSDLSVPRPVQTGSGATHFGPSAAQTASPAQEQQAQEREQQPLGWLRPLVVQLPGLSAAAVRLAVGALYDRHVAVGPEELEPLMAVASYLGAESLLEACAAVSRSSVRARACCHCWLRTRWVGCRKLDTPCLCAAVWPDCLSPIAYARCIRVTMRKGT
jgi:hypothetical protein